MGAPAFIAALAAPFGPGENRIVFPRPLAPDFNALARALEPRLKAHRTLTEGTETYLPLSRDMLGKAAASMTGAARAAAEFVLEEDMPAFGALFRAVRLRVVGNHNYAQEFHDDSTTRGLCAYNEPTTEYLLPGGARPLGDGFYAHVSGPVLSMPPGAAWRQAGAFSDPDIEPFVHRAPLLASGRPPRLLLTADGLRPKALP